jgi:colanic acid biosynthesis glycosyl transferase WcaI
VTTAKRIIHELTFSSFAFLNFLRAGKQDCIVVISPPLTLGLVGVLFKWLWGAKLVFHIQDLQTDAALSLGMVKAGFMTRTLIRAENFIYKHSDHVATITEGMKERLVQKGIPREKLGLYYNWINVAEAGRTRPTGRFLAKNPALRGKWIVAYAGNIGVKQGVDVLISLAEAMQGTEAVHFVIAGDGADKDRLQKVAGEKKLKNLTFLPFLSQEDYFDLLADIQVSFIAQRTGTGNVFFPSKLLGIMAMSRPVLISADDDAELSSFVRRHQSGLTARCREY